MQMTLFSRTVLIVDDDYLFLENACRQFALLFDKCDIRHFDSYDNAVKYIEQEDLASVSLLISDAVLGETARGSDLLLRIRDSAPHCKRVLMSDKATRVDLMHAINRCSLDGYIEKVELFSTASVALIRQWIYAERANSPVSGQVAMEYLAQLDKVPVGQRKAAAHAYKCIIRDLVHFVLYPHLSGPRTEVRLTNGTTSVDILFSNSSSHGILRHAQDNYGSAFVPVETKNTAKLKPGDFRQLQDYLIKGIGRLGFLCFRGKRCAKERRRLMTIANRSDNEPKVILVLTDDDLKQLSRERLVMSRIDYSNTIDRFLRDRYLEAFT